MGITANPPQKMLRIHSRLIQLLSNILRSDEHGINQNEIVNNCLAYGRQFV